MDSHAALVPAPQLQGAEELGIIVRRCGVTESLLRWTAATGAAKNKPERGTDHRQDHQHNNPGSLGDSTREPPIGPDHVNQTIDNDG